jgi:hypothetical protein
MLLRLRRLPPCLARFVAVCQFVCNLKRAEDRFFKNGKNTLDFIGAFAYTDGGQYKLYMNAMY